MTIRTKIASHLEQSVDRDCYQRAGQRANPINPVVSPEESARRQIRSENDVGFELTAKSP